MDPPSQVFEAPQQLPSQRDVWLRRGRRRRPGLVQQGPGLGVVVLMRRGYWWVGVVMRWGYW